MIKDHGKSSPTYDPKNPPLAVFDWDNTMILNDIGEATFLYLVDTQGFVFDDAFWQKIPPKWRAKMKSHHDKISGNLAAVPNNPNFRAYRKYAVQAYFDLCETRGDAVCYAWLVEILAGLTPAQVRAAAQNTLQRELNHPVAIEKLVLDENDAHPITVKRGIRYYPEMKELVKKLQRNGFDVWIISASTEVLVETAAQKIGMAPERVIGMQALTDQHGRFTDKVERFTYRQGKADAIQKLIGHNPIFAAGDSNTDIEMLLLSSGPRLVIDRGKKPLMDIAIERGWMIQPPFYSAKHN